MAQIKNFIIDKGSSFSTQINIEPYHILENYNEEDITVIGTIKKSSWSLSVIAIFNYYIDHENKYIVVFLNDIETSNILSGKYEYNIAVADNNKKTSIRVMEGTVLIRQ